VWAAARDAGVRQISRPLELDMLDKLFALTGHLGAAMGSLQGLSDEYKQFLASGYKCSKCGNRLLYLGPAGVNFYSSDGNRIPFWRVALRGAELAECSNCFHRWRVYSRSQPVASEKLEILGIIETARSEEVFGVDRRLIDNSKSSTKLTRRFSVSKEWAKTYSIEYEKAFVDGAEFNVELSEVFSIKASSEETLRKQYALSEETKETYLEEVEIEVPSFTKLSLIFQWKRIWQHGFIRLQIQNNKEIKIPCQIVVGVTFDQLQIDEKS
jgi:hypothetical protein